MREKECESKWSSNRAPNIIGVNMTIRLPTSRYRIGTSAYPLGYDIQKCPVRYMPTIISRVM